LSGAKLALKTVNPQLLEGKIHQEVQKYFPYANTRSYQGELANIIYQTVRSGKHLVVEAPAGLGKTIAALSACLPVAYKCNLQILYCCRTHQQMLGVLQELDAIRMKGVQVPGMGLYGKRHLCTNELLLEEGTHEPEAFSIACNRLREAGRCPMHDGSQSNPAALSDLANELLRGRFSPAEFRQLCRTRGLCSFDVVSTALPYAKVVTLPYHYLFNPWMRNYLLGRVHRTLGQEILIVDEAHNVPRIAAQSESMSLSLSTVEKAAKESREHGFHEISDVCRSIHCYFSQLEMPSEDENIRICLTDFEIAVVKDKRSNSEMNRVIRAVLSAGEVIQQVKLMNGQAPTSYLHSVGRFLSQAESRLWDPTYIAVQSRDIDRGGNERRHLELIQLLSRRATENVFSSVFSSLSMSGTLQPFHVYSHIIGLPSDALGVALPYPFPRSNALVLISNDVSTRQKERNRETFAKVVRMVAEASNLSPGNVAVFLASHEVLNELINIGAESLLKADFEVLTERRYMPSSEIDQLYRSFLRPSNSRKILLAVQGGRLSEGVDYIGNTIKTIVVVGVPYAKPSLPVSAQIELYRKLFGKNGRFYAYIVPALWSSLQAAGRGIRSPIDTCAIILLDRRFSREPLLSTLPGWMREGVEKTSLRDGSLKRRLILFFCGEVLRKTRNQDAILPHT